MPAIRPSLDRFVEAQRITYDIALRELRQGRKSSHWMWYIFPQLRGLGQSTRSNTFGIADADEARAYLLHPLLGERLRTCVQTLLDLPSCDALVLMGREVDVLKLRSSLTLFAHVSGESLFSLALQKYFGGEPCPLTIQSLLD